MRPINPYKAMFLATLYAAFAMSVAYLGSAYGYSLGVDRGLAKPGECAFLWLIMASLFPAIIVPFCLNVHDKAGRA